MVQQEEGKRELTSTVLYDEKVGGWSGGGWVGGWSGCERRKGASVWLARRCLNTFYNLGKSKQVNIHGNPCCVNDYKVGYL